MSHAQPAFGTQEIQALKKACDSFATADYPPKTEVLAQGTLADTVFVVDSGLVKLTHVESSGKEIIVGIRHPGWALGVAAAILHQPQPTSAVTVTHCRLLRIPAREIRDRIAADSMFCQYLHKLQAQEVQDHLLNIVELASHSTQHRLTRLLSELASSPAESSFQIPLKQWEIAELLGITPEHLCRVIRRLELQGFLVRRRKLLFCRRTVRLRFGECGVDPIS